MKKRWLFSVLIVGLFLSGCVAAGGKAIAGEKAKTQNGNKTALLLKPVRKYARVLDETSLPANMLHNSDFKAPLSKAVPNKDGSVNTQGSWVFYPNHGGAGNCKLENGMAKITPTKVDCPDYGIQLIQAPVVVEKGATYIISFDAYAAKPRSITVKIGGIENREWKAYSTEKVIKISTKRKTYKFAFTMKDATDRNARFEFWFATGQNPAPVWVTNAQMYKK